MPPNGLTWYAELALLYVSLTLAEFGYLGSLLVEDRWRERTLNAPLQARA